MLKTIQERANYVLKGEQGSLTTEQIVLISLALMLATLLFAFKDEIKGFLTNAGKTVNGLKVN